MSNNDELILVSGATGQQGGAAARHLLARGFKVRALTRDAKSDKTQALSAQGAEIVQGNLEDRATLDQALKVLENASREVLPKGYNIDYAGEARQLRGEGNKLTSTLAISIVLIFLVLAAQFESFRDPFIILAGSVPLALAGALLVVMVGAAEVEVEVRLLLQQINKVDCKERLPQFRS